MLSDHPSDGHKAIKGKDIPALLPLSNNVPINKGTVFLYRNICCPTLCKHSTWYRGRERHSCRACLIIADPSFTSHRLVTESIQRSVHVQRHIRTLKNSTATPQYRACSATGQPTAPGERNREACRKSGADQEQNLSARATIIAPSITDSQNRRFNSVRYTRGSAISNTTSIRQKKLLFTGIFL